jgi:mRNA interferase RelE/StbE
MKTVVYTDAAIKQLEALPKGAQEQVSSGLDRYAMTGQGDVKALQGRPGFRLRIGRYRVILKEDAITVLAIQIGKRDDQTYR